MGDSHLEHWEDAGPLNYDLEEVLYPIRIKYRYTFRNFFPGYAACCTSTHIKPLTLNPKP
jgi:hypothetical protein